MPDVIYINNFIPIPEIFHSEKSGEPFRHCAVCNKEILESGTHYMIEKAFKRNEQSGNVELVFEFVYCTHCIETFRKEFSKESRIKLDKYFRENTNFHARYQQFKKYDLFDTEVWLNNCVFKNQSLDDVSEYQIYAQCQGPDMLFYNAPYMVCGEAMEEVANLLSNKTLDILNNFWADHVDLPPELAELFHDKKLLLM